MTIFHAGKPPYLLHVLEDSGRELLFPFDDLETLERRAALLEASGARFFGTDAEGSQICRSAGLPSVSNASRPLASASAEALRELNAELGGAIAEHIDPMPFDIP